jgi:hypothetical protein
VKTADRYQETKMTDAFTKAVLTVIALALTVLAVRPLVEPQRVQAEGQASVEISQRLGKLELNTEVMRSAGNTNARRTNERFARQGWGVDVVIVEADAAGLMGARPEPAIQTPQPPPNPF